MVRHHKGKAPTGTSVGAAMVRAQKQSNHTTRKIYSINHTTLDNEGMSSVVDRNELDEYLTDVMLQHELYDDTTNNMLLIDVKGKQQSQQLYNNAPQSYVIPDTGSSNNNTPESEHNRYIQQIASTVTKIPRRPSWATLNSYELDLAERNVFMEWRKNLSTIEQQLGRNQFHSNELTPYEKNLSVWRQLWRVVDRSNIICQIVDARNPLLYYCHDIELYCDELFGHTDNKKLCVLIINKSDYLTDTARQYWKSYFTQNNIKCIFWSAVHEQNRLDKLNKLGIDDNGSIEYDDNNILNRLQLIQYIRDEYHTYFGVLPADHRIQVGMVGYPNVGKSSTINVLMGSKRVSVASMPGKTKHFQTLNLYDDIILIDAPGLVFPSLLSSRAELVVNGILNIDQLKQFDNIIAPVQVIVQRISHQQFIDAYGLSFDIDHSIDAMTLLQAHAKMRGYNKLLSQPDTSRSARIIIKDYTSGKLLYCHQPPTLTHEQQQQWIQSYQEDTTGIIKQNNTKTSDEQDEQSIKSNNKHPDNNDEHKHGAVDTSAGDDESVDININSNTALHPKPNRKINTAVMNAVMKENAEPLQLNSLRISDSSTQPSSNQPLTKKQLRRLIKQSRKPIQKLRRNKAVDDMNDVQVHIRGVSDQPMNYMAYSTQIGNPIESNR